MPLRNYPGPEEHCRLVQEQSQSFKAILRERENEYQTLREALILQTPDIDVDSAPQLRALIGWMKVYNFLIAYCDEIDDWQGERLCCNNESEESFHTSNSHTQVCSQNPTNVTIPDAVVNRAMAMGSLSWQPSPLHLNMHMQNMIGH